LADRLATLASGALALTVTFRSDLAGQAHLLILKLSWIGFILTIIGFLLVFLGKIEMHKRTVLAMVAKPGIAVIRQPLWMHFGRWCLIGGFLFGMICLAVFGWLAN